MQRIMELIVGMLTRQHSFPSDVTFFHFLTLFDHSSNRKLGATGSHASRVGWEWPAMKVSHLMRSYKNRADFSCHPVMVKSTNMNVQVSEKLPLSLLEAKHQCILSHYFSCSLFWWLWLWWWLSRRRTLGSDCCDGRCIPGGSGSGTGRWKSWSGDEKARDESFQNSCFSLSHTFKCSAKNSSAI